ncbi:MAG: nitronate monooxygenase [Spirochaetales bacterium]|nr:nitronate monooxygenase [Spirochaetales bacterium]
MSGISKLKLEYYMLKTLLNSLLKIDYPIIQAGMGLYGSGQLAAAVSNAGGLGTVSAMLRSLDDTKRQLEIVKNTTSRPFAVNFVAAAVDEETFSAGIAVRPKLISMAIADPGEFPKRAHDEGALFMHQVTTVAQALEAAERNVDIIIAQGAEAGGYAGEISTFPLLPQVVTAVKPIPVVAAGGIFDGRGIAAALMLGAVGVNLGTRFLASEESPVTQSYREVIIEASSIDAVKIQNIMEDPPPGLREHYEVTLRGIRKPFANELGQEMDYVTAGQSAGGIAEILPAAEILRQLAEGAVAALAQSIL